MRQKLARATLLVFGSISAFPMENKEMLAQKREMSALGTARDDVTN